jgi:hypothetical protein
MGLKLGDERTRNVLTEVIDFREMLPRYDSPGRTLLLYWVYWDPTRGGQATSEITVIRLRIECQSHHNIPQIGTPTELVP